MRALRGWRRELVGAELAELLAGRRAVTVDARPAGGARRPPNGPWGLRRGETEAAGPCRGTVASPARAPRTRDRQRHRDGGRSGGAAPGATPAGGGSGGGTPTAPATPAPAAPSPLHLHASTLAQDGGILVLSLADLAGHGRRLRWASDDRSLCLRLVYRAGGTSPRATCASRARAARRDSSYARVLRSGGHGPLHAAERASAAARRALARRALRPGEAGDPVQLGALAHAVEHDGCRRRRRAACFDALPADGAMLSLRAPQPVGCTPAGPSYVTNGSRSRHVVALTFDDGPSARHARGARRARARAGARRPSS